jgi:hypothetical protein
MIAEMCNKNGRKFSPIVGCPVSSERMPSSGETNAKMEKRKSVLKIKGNGP